MEQNKTARYFKYAIGEIVLVVIGILIALSINNWNETRKEQALELDYLIGIKNDLETDIPFTERRATRILYKLSALHKIDSTLVPSRPYTPHDVSLDSISMNYMFDRGPLNRLTLGSYTTLTSNASVGLIKNTELLQLIQEFYDMRIPSSISIYQDIRSREEYVGWKYAHELKTQDLQTFFIDNPNRDEVLADFAYYYRQQALMYRYLLRNRDIMVEIIKAIDAELEQRQ